MTFAFVRKFWPFGLIVALGFVVLFQRNTITSRTAARDAAQARVKDVSEANAGLQRTLDVMAKARIDNDAIAEAVAKRIGNAQTRLVETRTIIEKARRDDPVVRDWGAVPVPSRVREALRTREADSATR
jgi:hypothetical protein